MLMLFTIANLALAYLICDVIHYERGLRSPVVHGGQAIESCSSYGKKYMLAEMEMKGTEKDIFLASSIPDFKLHHCLVTQRNRLGQERSCINSMLIVYLFCRLSGKGMQNLQLCFRCSHGIHPLQIAVPSSICPHPPAPTEPT